MIWTMRRILIAFRTGVHFRSSSIGSSGISALFLQGSKKVLDVSKAEGTRISLWLLSISYWVQFHRSIQNISSEEEREVDCTNFF
ncbi:MAG: hypothetical protein V3R13_04880, partial [Nitrososphaerales archaeon]